MTKRHLLRLATMLLMAGSLFAQPGLGPIPGSLPSPAEMQKKMLEFWTSYLSLTEAQQQQAKGFLDAEQKDSQALHESFMHALDALHTAEKESRSDIEIERLAAEAGAVSGQLMAIHSKAQAKFYAILAPDQKAKLEKMPGGPDVIGFSVRVG